MGLGLGLGLGLKVLLVLVLVVQLLLLLLLRPCLQNRVLGVGNGDGHAIAVVANEVVGLVGGGGRGGYNTPCQSTRP